MKGWGYVGPAKKTKARLILRKTGEAATGQARTRTHDGGLPVKKVVAHRACRAVCRRISSYNEKEGERKTEEEGEEGKGGKKSGEWTQREPGLRATEMYNCLKSYSPVGL